MKDIVIIGAGGFAREVAWLIEEINKEEGRWNLLGYIDEDTMNHGALLNGYKVLGGFEYFNLKEDIFYVIAVGNSKARKKLANKCKKNCIKPATLIHPSIIMSRTSNIGEGSIVCAENIITVNVNIGKHVLINISCTVGHDVSIGDYVTVYPGVNISGSCNIRDCVEIGTGSKLIQGKSIGENTIIGAGTVVVRDVEDNCTAVGVPARVIRKEEVYE